jgi:TetR/AcrR family transcriptional regulator
MADVATTPMTGPRRASTTADRGPAAQRTRERILTAAVAEFGAKGYAGARTAGIAARAGVNQQLISYYFGGKKGLLDELRRRWADTEAGLVPPDATFGESVAAYLDATLDRPDWARLVLWQALGDPRDDEGSERSEARRAHLRAGVERTRRRQAAGEITDAVDPEFVVLIAHLLAFAPVAMPQIVGGLFDVDPLSLDYRQRCVAQLLTLVSA